MPESVSNSDLLNFLMEIKEDLGTLKAGHMSVKEVLASTHHAALKVEQRLGSLEMSRARQGGALAVIGVMTSAIGAGIEYAVTHLLGRHP